MGKLFLNLGFWGYLAMARRKWLLTLWIGCWAGWAAAQEPPAPVAETQTDSLVVPQVRNSVQSRTRLEAATPFANVRCVVPKVSAQVTIQNEVAETELLFQCLNVGKEAVRAPIAVPLPKIAQPAPKPLGLEEQKKLGEALVPAQMLSPQKALPVWQNLAKQQANPAALEFCGSGLLKTDPVNLPAGQSTPVRLNYVFACPSEGQRYDYVLPRSESVEYAVPWSVRVDIQTDKPISTVYSPSHKLRTKRLSANSIQVEVEDDQAAQPGGFWLSYLIDQGGLSATLFTQPDDGTPGADGTFLFLAGVPAVLREDQAISRELTLALDRSGSMQGKKIEQVRAAATEVLGRLNEGESFNIITYNDRVRSFSDKPVKKTQESFTAACEFIDSMQPRGGTNLHAALVESVRQKPTPETLPIVLFLTDGLPTVGETAEAKIRDVIATQNTFQQRIFTVGVGVDVNTPLLEAIATETRAQPTFVLPTENVKTKLSQVFENLERPVLAGAVLEISDANARASSDRVSDVFPDPLPDLFQDDHLVVLGRYQGSDPLVFRVRGNYLGAEKTFEFTFPLKEQPSYPFVSRLWATQKIADLVQQIRKSGATADPYDILANPKQDPKLKRLAEETLKLTTRYGILTEYTAFLAKDNSWLDQNEQLERAYRNFDERAVKTRVGLSSVNQSINNTLLQRQYHLSGANTFWDANMQRVAVPNVQQLESGAFFLRGNTWVDGRLVNQPNITPTRIITTGSPDYKLILDRLVETGEHKPLSLSGDVLMEIDDKPVLIRARALPAPPPAQAGLERAFPSKAE